MRYQSLLSREKKTFGYKERDETVRTEFLKALEGLTAEQIVYMDEAGIEANATYLYGWAQKGRRAYAKKSGKRQARMNFMGALCGKTFKAPFMFQGCCHSLLFEAWLEACLIPELEAGQVLILDNATFHKSAKAKALIEAAQCRLLFLPPYSPDFNPIEHEWFPIKHYIRQWLDEGMSVEKATEKALMQRCETKC